MIENCSLYAKLDTSMSYLNERTRENFGELYNDSILLISTILFFISGL